VSIALSRFLRRNGGRRDLSRLSFPGYVESRIAPLCSSRSYPRAFREEDETRFARLYPREQSATGENMCARVCRVDGVGDWRSWWSCRCLASCLMSTDSSYAECHVVRDRFNKTRLENSETRAFISRPTASLTKLHPSHARSRPSLPILLAADTARCARGKYGNSM